MTGKNKEKYLAATFGILKKKDGVVVSDKKTRFKDTELRLISEILAEEKKGKRLISTELARRLGITRSAVSQIVNQLEGEGVLRRVPDEVDRKIAYIEVEKSAMKSYEADMEVCAKFVGEIVEEYGEEKFETFCALFDEFMDCVNEKVGRVKRR